MSELIISIKGMHCKSCTILITEQLEKIPGVTGVKVDLNNNQAIIKYDGYKPSNLELSRAIQSAGRDYSLGTEEKSFINKSVIKQFFINLVIIWIIFLVLEKTGLTNLKFSGLNSDSGWAALLIGVTAGFSTCMALIGGLVLGLSPRFSEKHQSATTLQRFRPHIFFNLGRILTFFALGGLIGLFGSIFKIDSTIMGLLTIAVGLVMVILGLQLTELFPKLTNKSITLPVGISKSLGIKKHNEREYSHKNAMVLGGLTFFLPCGFTQAMQLVAISSGSFVTGSIVMGLFAIGTAPGLLGIGGLTSFVKGKFAKTFFRFAGVAVVLMAIYNISNGWLLTGYKFDLNFNFPSSSNGVVIDKDAIILKTNFNVKDDVSVKDFTVEAGKSYVLEVNASEDGQGCMSTIMIPGVYNTPVLIRSGITRLPFKATKAGKYNITCAMGIVRGSLTVTEGK